MLFPSLYSCDNIFTVMFSISILSICAADGLFTLNSTFTVFVPCSNIFVDNISGKSASSTSGNSIYSCLGITSGIFSCG